MRKSARLLKCLAGLSATQTQELSLLALLEIIAIFLVAGCTFDSSVMVSENNGLTTVSPTNENPGDNLLDAGTSTNYADSAGQQILDGSSPANFDASSLSQTDLSPIYRDSRLILDSLQSCDPNKPLPGIYFCSKNIECFNIYNDSDYKCLLMNIQICGKIESRNICRKSSD